MSSEHTVNKRIHACISAVLLCMFILYDHVCERESVIEPSVSRHADTSIVHSDQVAERTPDTINRLIPNPSQISSSRASDAYNPQFLYLKDYRERVDKHLKLKLYQVSPARDTLECKQIENILKKYGLGSECVYEAYSIAWQFHHEIAAMIEPIEDLEFRKKIIEQKQSRLIQTFLRNHHIQDDTIIREILKVKPIVFFGNIFTDVQLKAGDRLLVN